MDMTVSEYPTYVVPRPTDPNLLCLSVSDLRGDIPSYETSTVLRPALPTDALIIRLRLTVSSPKPWTAYESWNDIITYLRDSSLY